MKNFILVLLLIPTGNAFACDCPPLNVKEAYKQAGNVFTAKIIKMDSVYSKSGNTLYWYNVQAIQTYKIGGGNFKDAVFGFYADPHSNCDFIFEAGKTYLIYADKADSKMMHAITCLRTALLDNVKESELKELKQLHAFYEAENMGGLSPQNIKVRPIVTDGNDKEITPEKSIADLLRVVTFLCIVIAILFLIIIVLLILYIKAKRTTK